jgi:hypothetical protein
VQENAILGPRALAKKKMAQSLMAYSLHSRGVREIKIPCVHGNVHMKICGQLGGYVDENERVCAHAYIYEHESEFRQTGQMRPYCTHTRVKALWLP